VLPGRRAGSRHHHHLLDFSEVNPAKIGRRMTEIE
jgi:hypothetical protein